MQFILQLLDYLVSLRDLVYAQISLHLQSGRRALQSHRIPCSADSLSCCPCNDLLAAPTLGPPAMLTFLIVCCPLFSLKHAHIFLRQLLLFRKKSRKGPPIITTWVIFSLPHKTLMLLQCSLRSASSPTSQLQAKNLASYFAEPSF